MRHTWPQKVPEVAAAALGRERKDCGLGGGDKDQGLCVLSRDHKDHEAGCLLPVTDRTYG